MSMKIKLFGLLTFLIVALSFPTNGRAQEDTLDYLDPLTVGRVIQSLGLPYQTQFDGLNRPRLTITDKNLRSEQFEIYFFNCKEDAECESITLWSWYKPTSPQSYFKTNSWNKKNRFIKGYLSDDYQPVMELDINAAGGLNRKNLEIMIRAYVKTMDGYGDFMTVAKKKKK